MSMVIEHFVWLGVLAVCFVPLELLFPEKRRERYLRAGWTLDMTFAVVNAVFIAISILAMLVLGGTLGSTLFPGAQTWVASQPLWLQVPVAIVLSDFIWYWCHRLAHRVPWLWRFHAVHHSIEMMDWMAGHRVHPVDQVVTRGSGLLVLAAVGFAPEAMGVVGLLFGLQGTLEHSNIPLRGGWLRHVLVLPQFHHWHHADHPEAYDRNFGGQLTIFDRLFGTWYEADQAPEAYGSSTRVDGGYVDMLLFPFRRPQPDAQADAQ